MNHRFAAMIAVLVFGTASNALAHTTPCPDLNTLQVWAGYLSWMGLFKVLGAAVITAGCFALFGGIIVDLLYHMRLLLNALAYVVSLGLIGSGYWVSPEYLTWTVFIGCILLLGSVMLTLFIFQVREEDPKLLASIFCVIWGGVAIYYNMVEVGFLSVLALMTVLGFTVVVGRLSYGFGWHEEAAMPSGTFAALLILGAFVVQKALYPQAPAFLQVFSPGAFWAGSIVAFTGLLIMSSKWYDRGASYFPMQIITVSIYLVCVAAGMILHINPLAGAAGTFLVFFLAAKPLEVPKSSLTAFGIAMICSGGIMFAAWQLATKYQDVVKQYLTMHLG